MLIKQGNIVARIESCVSLANKNWFRTGGTARFFTQPNNVPEFQEALAFAHQQSLPIFVFGQGANVLISDHGFNGLVIKPELTIIEMVAPDIMRVGAGVNINTLIEHCLDNNLLGLEEFSGIPGTVGGAMYINLHYFSFLIEHFLLEAQVIHKQTGQVITVDKAWFNFGYNQSTLHKEDHYLINATFRVTPATDVEVAYARGRRAEIIRHRLARYPVANTCGSFFRNFHQHEVSLMYNNQKAIWVAYYLDKVGIKGHLRVGGALVSPQHANMIINIDKASSSDIIQLARQMQERVYDQFSLLPQPECRLVGFDTYPLHQ